MPEKKNRIEEYCQSGYYYIPGEMYDLLWTDRVGEWRMTTSARNMRTCMELDKVDRELDGFGYEIVIGEFHLDPDTYGLERIRHMNPLELERTRSI